jgi:hypothetical protein
MTVVQLNLEDPSGQANDILTFLEQAAADYQGLLSDPAWSKRSLVEKFYHRVANLHLDIMQLRS